jgi:hypothetical protein
LKRGLSELIRKGVSLKLLKRGLSEIFGWGLSEIFQKGVSLKFFEEGSL